MKLNCTEDIQNQTPTDNLVTVQSVKNFNLEIMFFVKLIISY